MKIRLGAWIAFAIPFLIQGCGKKVEEIEKQCVTPADQSNLYIGHWPAKPIPLAVQAVDFSSGEQVAIAAAIGEWNTFFTASKGSIIYSTGTPLTLVNDATRITAATVCSHAMVNTSGFNSKIMIYKVSSNWTHGSSAIAITANCPVVVSGSPLKVITASVMEINYVNYFTGSNPKPDLRSVLTHELGHLGGLDHSCSGNACSTAPSDYVKAVMYPSLGFTGINGNVKTTLQKNDQQRFNCLY